MQSQELNIELPYKYTPRDYQEGLWRAGFPSWYGLSAKAATRYLLNWHRRAGKDKTTINFVTAKAVETVGNYLYMLPEQTQAKKVIWLGMGSDGMKFIDHIPYQIIKRKYEKDMLIELINGSTIQLGGSDNFDSWMGTNPRGIIFSEYSVQNPQAYDYFRPILAENKGWAVFIYTARGHNHGWSLLKLARERIAAKDKSWYLSELNVDQTFREDGVTPVISQADIEAEIDAGMPPEMVKQEFYNSFDSGMIGSYYADLLEPMYKGVKGRKAIGHYPYIPGLPVTTAWDIGIHDSTAIWFFQMHEGGPRVIEYYEERNKPLTEHITYVLSRPYNYLEHIGPHDLEQREKSNAKKLHEFALECGLDFTVNPMLRIDDGIEQVRSLLPTCVFNEATCEFGLETLMAYERVWDDKLKRLRDKPLHNWASHGADAFRTLAVGYVDIQPTQFFRPSVVHRSI